MVVRDVTLSQLKEMSGTLACQIFKSGYRPELVVAVGSGGIIPGLLVFNELERLYSPSDIEFVQLKKTGKQTQGRVISRILKRFPTAFLNVLRIFSLRAKSYIPQKEFKVSEKLISAAYKSILIVDDAVDSGKTLSSIIRKIKRDNIDCEIKTAVLTVTMSDLESYPDYRLFNNGIILRMPWARDAK